MQQANATRYDRLSQAFHWLTAIAVLVAFILGPGGFGRLLKQGIDPATRPGIVWHESLGILILSLTLLRLLWVAVRPAPPDPAGTGWMKGLARVTHAALWILLLVLPLTALLTLAGEGGPLTLLGGLRLEHFPVLSGSKVAGAIDWGDVHGFLGDTLMWLAGLHALAALFHHFVLRDGVLKSMVPLPRR